MIWSAPAAFWLASALVAIVALHAIRRHRRRMPTTTLHIWRGLSQDTRSALRIQRLVPDLPLLLQLLLTALLVMALARPLFISEVGADKDIVLVMDASASMNARDGNTTRFEAARKMALELVDGLTPGQRMALVAMAGDPRLVLPFGEDKGKLRAAIGAMTATDGSADLMRTLTFALAQAKDLSQRQVVLIGDGAYHKPDGSAELLNGKVRFLPVGRIGDDGDNIGLVQFAYRPNVPPHPGGELLVALRSYAKEGRGVTFSVHLSNTEVLRHSFEVPPDTQYSLIVPVPEGARGAARAVLEHDDGLVTDNTAYALVGGRQQAKVLLVGTADPPLRAALQAIPDVRVTYANGSAAGGPPPAYGEHDLLLFNRVQPPEEVRGTLVVIGLASPVGGVRSKGWVKAQRVTGWLVDDILLRSLDPRQLWVSRSLRLIPDAGTEILVSGVAGPLVVRRESGGTRAVTLAFDLREPGFGAPESFPLFMANLVDWARPKARWEPGQRVAAGSAYTWRPQPGDGELHVTGPEGRTWDFPAGPEPVRFQSTERAGIYRFAAAGNGDGNGRIEQLAVNLLDAAESRIDRNPDIVGYAGEVAGSGTREVAYDGWFFLVLAGVLFLLIEWLIWIRIN